MFWFACQKKKWLLLILYPPHHHSLNAFVVQSSPCQSAELCRIKEVVEVISSGGLALEQDRGHIFDSS